MKSLSIHRKEIKELAERLEKFNQIACIEFARILRLNDEQKLICRELGLPEEDLIDAGYCEAVYRLLAFGTKSDRFTLLVGNQDEINALVSRVRYAKGFEGEGGVWIELG